MHRACANEIDLIDRSFVCKAKEDGTLEYITINMETCQLVHKNTKNIETLADVLNYVFCSVWHLKDSIIQKHIRTYMGLFKPIIFLHISRHIIVMVTLYIFIP